MDWPYLNNILGALASGFIVAGALIGIVAGVIRTVRWWKKR